MVSTHTYTDLCREIDILDIRITSLEKEREQMRRMMFANAPKGVSAIDYSTERVQSSFSPLPLNEIVERINQIDKALSPLYEIKRIKEQAKMDMEQTISAMEGLDYKVAYLRMQGLTLIEIADELGYSYNWIKKVSSRTRH